MVAVAIFHIFVWFICYTDHTGLSRHHFQIQSYIQKYSKVNKRKKSNDNNNNNIKNNNNEVAILK